MTQKNFTRWMLFCWVGISCLAVFFHVRGAPTWVWVLTAAAGFLPFLLWAVSRVIEKMETDPSQ